MRSLRAFLSMRLRWATALACVCAVLAVPAPGTSATVGAGMVPQGTYDPCGRFDDLEELDFSFFGRMPAGSSGFQVLNGKATGAWGCNAAALIKLTGSTPSGMNLAWTCWGPFQQLIAQQVIPVPNPLVSDVELRAGPAWRLRGTCSTKGKPGRFSIHLLLASPFGDEDPREFLGKHRILGAYVAIAT